MRSLVRASTGLSAGVILFVSTVALACQAETPGRDSVAADRPEILQSTGEPLVTAGASLPHATDFLTAGCSTLMYAALDYTARARCRSGLTSRKYTHFYVYPYNESDFGGPAFDYYQHPNRFREILLELRAAGFHPVVWLVPDDAPKFSALRVEAVQALVTRLVPVVDDLVSSYVLGLELDEYWAASTVDRLGTHLSGLTAKPIAVHQTPGRWDYCKFDWCDYMILQYGFESELGDIERMTRAAIAELGKPVVAGEYEVESEERAIRRGDQGVAAGAAGFGNGGTPEGVARWRSDAEAAGR
ncbi:MAG TPA: hypothetical protein VFZ21_01110 [Gemmatimonadaceae bacterium]|nr:hypothetical protein [Gemmatimonadaceae bacterium]